MIPLSCACGKQLQARDEAAGRSVKCPACGAVLKVPAAPAAVQSTAPPPRAVAPPPSEQTTAWPHSSQAAPPSRPPWDERAPSRGLSGGALAAIIGGAVAAVLLLGVVVFVVLRSGQAREQEAAAREQEAVARQQEAANQMKQAAARAQSTNNLKLLLLAMHNYHDTYKQLPAHAIYSKDGRPLLSWRVAILPFIEQKQLYDRFRLDEPWDSPHNKQLLSQMPPVYAPVQGGGPPGHTHYQVFTGPNTPFNGTTRVRLHADFPDGTSNTFLIVEANSTVPWTQPADLAVAPGQPLPPLGGLWRGRFLAGMADASVRFGGRRIPLDVLRSLIDPRDGGVLPENWDVDDRP
jgi:hypothetical protein